MIPNSLQVLFRHLEERPHVAAGVYFLLFALSLELVHPYYFLNDDNVTGSLPQFVHNYRAISRGEIPLFNFYQYLGVPHLSQGQTMALYPPAYLAVLLSQVSTGFPWLCIDIFVIAHLSIAAVAMAILARSLGVKSGYAFLAGISWSTCSYNLYVGNNWINVSTAACYLPLCLYSQILFMRNSNLRTLVRGSLIRCLFILTGHVQFVLYASACEVAFLLIYRSDLASATRNTLALLSMSHIFAGIWSLGLLLPMFHLAGESIRGAALSFGEYSARRPEPLDVICGIFLPICPAKGIPISFDSISYVGVMPPLVAAYFMIKLLRKQTQEANCRRLWLSTAYLGLSMMVVIPEEVIGGILPVSGAITRAIYCFQIVPSVLAFRYLHKCALGRGLLALDIFLFVWLLFGMAYRIDLAQLTYMAPVINRFRWPFKWIQFGAFYSILAASLGTAVMMRSYDKNHRRWMVMVGVIASTVLNHHIYFNRPSESFLKLANTTALLDPPVALPGSGRVVSMVSEYRAINPALIGFNFATLREVPYLGGYSPMVPATAYELSLYSNYFSSFECARISESGLYHLIHWGVRWLLADKHCHLSDVSTKMRGSYEHFDLYELPAEPLVRLSRSLTSEIIPQMHTNYLEFQTDTKDRDVVTVAYRAQKNLQVFIDANGPIQEMEDPFGRIAVAVPPGSHTVTVRYREPLFVVGVCISLMFAAAVIVLGYRGFGRNLSLSGT